jgi:hypothetical protein
VYAFHALTISLRLKSPRTSIFRFCVRVVAIDVPNWAGMRMLKVTRQQTDALRATGLPAVAADTLVFDTNIDAVWDAITNPELIPRWFLARFLDRASEADAARWLTGDTISYADEAVAMRSKLPVSRRLGYGPAGKAPIHKISYKYIGAQRDRMREQLLKGGLRLAGVLNAIFQ